MSGVTSKLNRFGNKVYLAGNGMVQIAVTGRKGREAYEIGLFSAKDEQFQFGGYITSDGAVQLDTRTDGSQHVSYDSLKWIVEMVEELVGEERIAD